MKTFCEVCTANPATLVCCADDAVMCGSCDQRCARDAGNTANRRKTASLSSRFASAAGPESRDATGDETRGRLVSTRGPPIRLSSARSSASRPGTDPRALPPTPLYPTGSRSIHSANAVVAKHERVAFSANARPMCDICQVRLTATRRNTRAARRWMARRGARAVARRARRGRRRVATDSEFGSALKRRASLHRRSFCVFF